MSKNAVDNNEILYLKPVLKCTIWGGNRLAEYGYELPSDHVGECWGISAHPNGDGTIEGGRYDGYSLSKLYSEHRELFGDYASDTFPLLTKIIDAKSDLSIQVHPDNDYAFKNENGSLGKMECWYILDAEPDTTIIVGHNAETKDEMISMIDEHRFDELIREIPVKKGDFFQINPGTVHAIKGGTVILETQQSSDITYRLFDYDRLDNGKLRELHLKQSKDVIRCPYVEPELHAGGYRETKNKVSEMEELANTDYYTVWKVNVKSELRLIQDMPFMLASVIEGEGTVNSRRVSKGAHMILPSGIDDVILEGDMELIVSAPR